MARGGYRLGLVGYPLEHSLSPVLHHAALEGLGLHGEYRLYPIPPEQAEDALPRLLDALRRGELHGLNVTLPYKQRVLAWLDRLAPEAQVCAAVNTLVRHEGTLQGHNTDAPGFWHDLQHRLPQVTQGTWCGLVLGAGGAARAVVYALLRQGWTVHVVARRLAQAQDLVHTFHNYGWTGLQAHPWETLLDPQRPWWQGNASVLVVNATPVGMHPHTQHSPWPQDAPWPPGAAYDLVYNPRTTRFVQQAREAGLPAVAGLGMLVAQAAYAFHLWTGAPTQRVYALMAQAVGLEPTGPLPEA